MIHTTNTYPSRRNHYFDPLRRFLQQSLARDLSLPPDHHAVTATMDVLSRVSLQTDGIVVTGGPIANIPDEFAHVTLETLCCLAACTVAETLPMASGCTR